MSEFSDSNTALEPPADPCAFVIFGASGDLTGRKLIPALYNLNCQGLLPKGFAVLGFAIDKLTDDEFRDSLRDNWLRSSSEVAFSEDAWNEFAARLHYLSGSFDNTSAYEALKSRLAELQQDHGCAGNTLFYLATSPTFFGPIINKLGQTGLAEQVEGRSWTRVVIEKPFGRDIDSAKKLNRSIHKVFKEPQIYRIDHYLGKETVQNIIAFRFANTVFEPIWNRSFIDHVQITAAESLGVEHRGKYYEQAGVVRDMFQNHLFQLLALVAMEPPVRRDSESVRDHKSDVLKAIVPIDPEQIGDVAVFGQYGSGIEEGKAAVGYRQEKDVAPNSKVETYTALKLIIDNWRWADVPFYLRSGKRLARKVTEIVIQFKRVPHMFFEHQTIEPNRLIIRIQPDEGISLRLGGKKPGPGMYIDPVKMDFSFTEEFGPCPATAYETLLLDAMQGDPTLFNRADAVELAWTVLEPLLRTWEATRQFARLPNYASGSWGPAAADDLLRRDGRAWYNS